MAATSTTLNVPFNFTVNGHNLPAGEYSVVRSDNMAFVSLKSTTTSDSYTWIASPSAEKANRVSLKFDADSHALESVQYGVLISPRIEKGSRTRDRGRVGIRRSVSRPLRSNFPPPESSGQITRTSHFIALALRERKKRRTAARAIVLLFLGRWTIRPVQPKMQMPPRRQHFSATQRKIRFRFPCRTRSPAGSPAAE